MPYEKNGGAGVRTVTYMRSSGFLPPTLENAMTGEPEKSLIFFWAGPARRGDGAAVGDPHERIGTQRAE